MLLLGKDCLDLYVCYNITLKEQDSNEIFSIPVITLILLENKVQKPSYLLKNDISKFFLNVRSILSKRNYIDTTVIACYVPPRQLIGNVLINIYLYLDIIMNLIIN